MSDDSVIEKLFGGLLKKKPTPGVANAKTIYSPIEKFALKLAHDLVKGKKPDNYFNQVVLTKGRRVRVIINAEII